jgi:hypothetical protein
MPRYNDSPQKKLSKNTGDEQQDREKLKGEFSFGSLSEEKMKAEFGACQIRSS